MWNGGLVNFINDSIIHLCIGEIFEIQGLKFFVFGRVDSIDKEVRTVGRTWWAREMPSDKEYAEGLKNLAKHNWEVDYILTHDCSIRTFEKLKELAWVDNPVTPPLRSYLDILEDEVGFMKWFFGHYHEELDLDEKYTLLYRNFVRIL